MIIFRAIFKNAFDNNNHKKYSIHFGRLYILQDSFSLMNESSFLRKKNIIAS